MEFAVFSGWCLTYKLNGLLRWAGIWARLLKPKCRPAAMGPVERPVRQHRLVIEAECMSADGDYLCG